MGPGTDVVNSLAFRQTSPGGGTGVNEIIGNLRVATSFEDLSLETIPEPTSLILLGLGLGSLVGSRIRRKID